MIFDLIKRLFSTSKLINIPMPAVLDEQPSPKLQQTKVVKLIPEHEQSGFDRLSLATSFNDLLLGAQTIDNQPPNEAERFVISGLENMLQGKIPDSAVPRLPEVAMALLKELADPHVTQETIMMYINRDPALASEVLHMSNSALFRVMSGPKIVNLDKALVVLGLNNLKAIVSSALMKRLMLIAPIYFRMFGQHLWQHSLDCAHTCRTLANLYGRADPNNAYLVGLMHDTGKLAIFSLLTQALAQNLDIQPRGSVFSCIVRDNSQSLSARIAREWSLPDYLLIALDEQIDTKPVGACSTYGSILNQANMLAEFKAVTEMSVRSNESFDSMLEKHGIPLHLFKEVFPKETEVLMNGWR
ncbi:MULTISPECIES: HDOD domain-containing protein [Methylobacter]